MCQDMSLNPSLLLSQWSPLRSLKFSYLPAFVCGNTLEHMVWESSWDTHKGITWSMSLSNLQTLLCYLWQRYQVLAADECHISAMRFRPQYFSLSSNCIKMINTLHLLVTFTQDKCYVIIANGKIVCFLFQNNGAVIHTKQRILILFFWRLTSCAINGRAKFKPIIMHLGWGRCPRFCPYNWQINQSCYLNPYRI